MKAKLLFASTVTLGILFGFVFFIFALIAYFLEVVDWPFLIIGTIFVNLLMWLVSPFLMDLTQRWFYKARFISFDDFAAEHREVADFIKDVCAKKRIKVPSLRVIDDLNPTAYCYGSYPGNSRLTVSNGIFKYLSIEEQKAVYAHELGHIVNWDFAVMTIAATLLEVLYEIYWVFVRARKGRSGKKDPTPAIGMAAYVLYFVGQYLLLYLSRTREYLADRFSAEMTGKPDALSLALVRIAYGIAVEAEGQSTERLLAATRSMGVYDYKTANSIGSTFKFATGKSGSEIVSKLTKVFLFDFHSPWAFISEIYSTHPLTGKRIRHLSSAAREMGLPTIFDFATIDAEGAKIDKSKMYGEFFGGVFFNYLPGAVFLLGAANIVFNPLKQSNAVTVSQLFLLTGVASLVKGFYRYGRSYGLPVKSTVLTLMQNPYANPVRGDYVELEGSVIGKADAGSLFGEDVKMADNEGGFIYLNYESLVPVFGNMFFGLTKAKEMIGKKVTARGWFRRSAFQFIDLDSMEVEGRTVKSFTRFWGLFGGLIWILLGLFSFFVYSSGSIAF